MIPPILWMREKFYLKRNPFPQGAILSIGSGEASESGLIYNPQVNEQQIQEYVQKFVIMPSLSKGSGFGALWSLGTRAPTSEARGYGKSSLGLYIAREINKDFGKLILTANKIDEGEQQPFLLASYATFKKQIDTGFNAIAFRHLEWLSQPQPGFYDKSPLSRLRDSIVRTLPSSYEPGSFEERGAIVTEVRSFRSKDSRFAGSTLGPMDGGLLNALSSPDPATVVSYLRNISPYSIWRNGFAYLDTVITFTMRAGVTKLILFIDQVEDFASPDIPRSKRLKEVERFRDIVKETCPFNSLTFSILTMHPRGWDQVKDLWRDARLADVVPQELGGSRENLVRVQLLREIVKLDDAKALLESYLQHSEYRIPGAPSPLHPWTDEAIHHIMQANGGRAGYILAHARDLVDLAAEQNVETIDVAFARGTEPVLVPGERVTEGEAPREEGLPPQLR